MSTIDNMNFFVTGGSSGIGKEIVANLIKQGHNVAFTYFHNEDRAKALVQHCQASSQSTLCRAYCLDVKSSDQVEKTVDAVVSEFGTIDTLISNAGINLNQLVVTTSDEEWLDVLNTNLTGAFYVSRAILAQMLTNRFGRLIFISSIAQGGATGQAAYAASKAALVGLSNTIAKEYGSKGITSNVIIPGLFPTDLSNRDAAPTVRDFWLKFCPEKRMGNLDEISHLIQFLASKEASFINGTSIPLTGGLDWMP